MRISRASALPAAALALAALALYRSQPHRGLFENGPELMELWRRGIVVHGHALLLPLARLAAALGLAGSPAVPDRAVSLVSGVGAALAVFVVTGRAASWSGLRAALAAGALLGLAPALRFYAGAVETRALGCGCAAVAGALAAWAAPTRARALAAVTAGYALACAAHASLVVLGPPLLLLHADAELRAGRRLTVARLAGAGALLVAGALATAGALYLADQALNPRLSNVSSWMVFYLDVSRGWGAQVGRPHLLAWTMSELLGPANALLPLALVGIAPLLRRAPWRCVALVLWTMMVVSASYGVASRQLGGYFLAALPALGWLAAEGLRHLFALQTRSAALGAAGLTLVALLAVPAGLDAWQTGGGDRAYGDRAHRPWVVQRGDLALPWPAPVGDWLAPIHPLLWLLGGALAALAAGRVVGTAATPDPSTSSTPRAAPALAVVGVALALQVAGGEAFRERWPIHWGQTTREYCEAARATLGPRDRLFTAVHTTGVAWQFNYYLGDRWTNIGTESFLLPEQRGDWLAGIEAELEHVRAEGGTAYLGQNGLLVLEARRAASPLALAAAHRWLDEGRVVLWSPR
jgi:hypothetical protein